MPKRTFKSVPPEELEKVENAIQHFQDRGYSIQIEKDEIGFPFVPTFVCKRKPTTIIIEYLSEKLFDRVAKTLMERVNNWVSYARSSGTDTRIALCFTQRKGSISLRLEQKLRDLGVGLYKINDDGSLSERIVPNDLALNIDLPQLNLLPKEIRAMLGPAYEQFDRSHWREGFGDACQAFENAAKKYFKAGCRSGRISIIKKSSAYTPTSKEIDKWTMGKLAKTFPEIISQNHKDKKIGKALKRTYEDRNKLIHNKGQGVTENRLRKNVGRHMWTIVAAMKELI